MSTPLAKEVAVAVAGAATLAEVGAALVRALQGAIPFDRLNIGQIDASRNEFNDAFVHGRNVPGRATGHRRTLAGSVVEVAVRAVDGFAFGSSVRAEWTARFPNFGPVYDSGVRSMLAVPIRDDGRLVAALVLASGDPQAYGDAQLAAAIEVGRSIAAQVVVALGRDGMAGGGAAGDRHPNP